MYVCANPDKERKLVKAVTLCKTTTLSLAHAWTDITAGSGCTSDFYATTTRCWHTATLLYSRNSEQLHLLNPTDSTPLETSYEMSAEHKMSGTLTCYTVPRC